MKNMNKLNKCSGNKLANEIFYINNKYIYFTQNKIFYILMIDGDWGLGIGDWGLGIGDWAQSPIPNPHPSLKYKKFYFV